MRSWKSINMKLKAKSVTKQFFSESFLLSGICCSAISKMHYQHLTFLSIWNVLRHYSLLALPGRGTRGCSRWLEGALQPGPLCQAAGPCWRWWPEGLLPGRAAGPASGSGESQHRKHPEEDAKSPTQTQRVHENTETQWINKKCICCGSFMKRVFTNPDILYLAAIHQLMFQHFEALCSYHHHTLQHLNTQTNNQLQSWHGTNKKNYSLLNSQQFWSWAWLMAVSVRKLLCVIKCNRFHLSVHLRNKKR